MKIRVNNARLAFPSLFTPSAGTEGFEPRYGASLLMAPDNPAIAELKTAMLAAVAAKHGSDKAPGILEKLFAKDLTALKDGDDKPDYTGFPGNMYLATSSPANRPPALVDQYKNRIETDNGMLYAGCYVNAVVEPWYLVRPSLTSRICCTLIAVQFRAHGESFGGSRYSEDDFDVIEDDGTSAADLL